MPKPVKRSIAVLIRNGDQVLALRRPEDDDELPGIWGLPAGTFRPSETLNDLIQRIGCDKLEVSDLAPTCKIAEGVQDRPTYCLEMDLWEASMTGKPQTSNWKWSSLDVFKKGRNAGSLCCELALRNGG